MTNERVGLFGGTFNPIHLGHIQTVLNMIRRQNLTKVFVIPNRENPLKGLVDGPTPEQRLEMVRLGFASYSDQVEVDDQEVTRQGPSYAIDTIRSYLKKYQPEQIYLIIGADQLESLDRWKNFEEILGSVNLLVSSRPGSDLPLSAEDLPGGIKALVDVYEKNFVQLKTGRYIEFVRLEDVDVSATDIRKRLRTGRGTQQQLPLVIEEYIESHGLYQPVGPKIGDYETFTKFCSKVLTERKALNVRAFDLRGLEAVAEFVIVASGTSTRHATALAENVVRAVKEEYGVLPQSLEGLSEGRWVLADFGSLIVHIFYDFVRQEYQMEELWRNAKEITASDPGSK